MEAAPYPQGSHTFRATALSFIAALHVAAGLALASLGSIVMEVGKAPLPVLLLPQPAAPRPAPAPRTLPLPEMRPPEVRQPSPPPHDNLYVVTLAERPAPPSVVTAAVSGEATPGAPPTIEPPRGDVAYLNNPAPAYPSLSRRAGERGRVLLRVRVDAAGQVESVEVQSTSGFARLDEAALNAVRRWRFLPARLGERAVAGVAIVPIQFELG